MDARGSLAWLRLESGTVRRGVALACAAWLSFAVASFLHVGNAYWAAMPVWVLTQPSRGLVLERALYRVFGTLIGAAAGLLMVGLGGGALAQVALLSGWVAAMAGLTHLLRGVSSYGALLAGMTAAIVVLPELYATAGAAGVALARVECTLVGVLVSTAVLAWLTPNSELTEIREQARELAADAFALAARWAMRSPGVDQELEEHRLIRRMAMLESSARLLSAGSVSGYRRLRDVDALVVALLTMMAEVLRLRDAEAGSAAEVADYLFDAGQRLRGGEGMQVRPEGSSGGTGATTRLFAAAGAVRVALEHLGGVASVVSAAARGWTPPRLAPHREWFLARRAAVFAGGACLLVASTGLVVPWSSMSLVALGVCIFGMLLSSLPQPQQIAPKLVAGVFAGVATAWLYRLAVQPHVTSSAMVLLSLIPFVLVGGMARAHPRTAVMAIDANMCFLLASQVGMQAVAPMTAISDGLALILPAILMAAPFILRPRVQERQALDAVAILRRDLMRILEARADAAGWYPGAMRQVLRLTLHLGRTGGMRGGLLAVLNFGHALIDARQSGLPEHVLRTLRDALEERIEPQSARATLLTSAADCGDEGVAEKIRELARYVAEVGEVLNFSASLAPFAR